MLLAAKNVNDQIYSAVIIAIINNVQMFAYGVDTGEDDANTHRWCHSQQTSSVQMMPSLATPCQRNKKENARLVLKIYFQFRLCKNCCN